MFNKKIEHEHKFIVVGVDQVRSPRMSEGRDENGRWYNSAVPGYESVYSVVKKVCSCGHLATQSLDGAWTMEEIARR